MLVKLILILTVLELLLYAAPLWSMRRFIALMLIGGLPGASLALAILHGGWVWLVSVAAAVRVLSLMRIVHGQRNQAFLRRMSRNVSWAGAVLTLPGLAAVYYAPPTLPHGWLVLAVMQFVVAFIALVSAVYALQRARPRDIKTYLTDHQLPSVSVVVPARNESQDLAECLESILASDYPKLEVIVLDDCSQDATPAVIKSFAHDGVRFVQGDEPAETWLAKNWAYQRLSEEATGRYILFCGVDVRLGKGAIRELVNQMHAAQLQMASVLPVRTQAAARASVVQPLRYWWELAIPRSLVGRPPVLSTCWMINRNQLQDAGSFASMTRAVLPEALLARRFSRRKAYAFLHTNDRLQVATRKPITEQRATAIRVRYPQLHQRMELSLALLLLEAAVLVGAPLLVFVAVAQGWAAVFGLSLTAVVMLLATHALITRATNPTHTIYALATFPVVAASELVLGLWSMLAYEFSVVTWKDRNVCVPVMRVIPALPDMAPKHRQG
ncbi:hypothetical protein CR970_00640 [Candidatus Saccharibacteria bacterium]|nr:MAG: hypothetical protein CR970_00640 [Candidatus Saccharibacteria bacterium]